MDVGVFSVPPKVGWRPRPGLVRSVADQAGPARILRYHRRSRLRPWRCRCGASFHRCGARQTALDEQLRAAAREACEWYPTYFADRGKAENATRVPRCDWPT